VTWGLHFIIPNRRSSSRDWSPQGRASRREKMWSEGLYRLAVVLRPFRALIRSPEGAVYISDVV